MKTEIEVKLLGVDKYKIIEKLKRELGATCLGEFAQKRYVYDVAEGDKSRWIRLRQKGDAVTLTYKQIDDDSIVGTKEIEVEVDDFETTHQFLEAIGHTAKSYQENVRTSFKLDGVDIEVDEWPRIEPYVEIEGASEVAVYETVEKLGFKREDCTSINTIEIYRRSGIDLDSIKDLRF